MTEISGHEAALPAQQKFYMPSQCCRCGKPGVKQVASTVAVSGLGRRTRSVTFPYCAECNARHEAITSARTRLFLSCFGLALLVSALGFLVPALPKAVLCGVPIALAVFAAVVLRAKAGETVEMPRGAWLSHANGKVTTFFMTNTDWAKEFASGNQIQALTPRVRKERWLVWPWALGTAAIAAAVVAFNVQPDVHVDNEGAQPVQIWIDGHKSIVAQPTVERLGVRPKVAVAYGKHRFGWSPVGASAPTTQTDLVKVEFSGDHLYNPEENACYFLDVSVYGSDTAKGVVAGPVPVQPFYTFKKVDNWFSENPSTVSTKSSGETRVALHPLAICKELAERGCDVAARSGYMSCLKGVYDADQGEEGVKTCLTATAKQCRGPSKK